MTAAPGPRIDGYADLREYAAIGDGRTVALVARDGRIDWLPVPGMADPPMFAAILDAQEGGRFALQPAQAFTTSREYLDGTNVLRTRFTTASGVVEVTDALVTGVAGRLPWMQLVRRIDGIEGAVPMSWIVAPGNVLGDEEITRFDTGNVPLLRAGGTNIALTGSDIGRQDPVHPGNGPATDWGPDFRGAFVTAPGSRHVLCLTGTEGEPIRVPDPAIADALDRPDDRRLAGLVGGVHLGRPLGRAGAPQHPRAQAAGVQPRPARSRPRRPPPSPRTATAGRTGTTGSPGCGTSRTRSTRSSGSGCGRSRTRPSPGC